MKQRKNRRWILISRPKAGPLDINDFCFDEQEIPPLQEQEFLVQNSLLSFDPAQRVWMERDSYMPKIALNDVVRALTIATVVESTDEQYPVGTKVAGLFGWQDYAVSCKRQLLVPMPIPSELPDEAALSVFGPTGLTAYFGMTEIGKPKANDVVVVSGASGATGSIAAQIAKACGAKVIGIAGGKEKCAWLLDKIKLDAAIDYKSDDVKHLLQSHAPNGVNVYFDNVGGAVLDHVLANLAHGARIVMCGAISLYDGTAKGALQNYSQLIVKRAKMEGFIISDFADRFVDGISALGAMVSQGAIAYEVDVQYGLENAPSTLQRLFDGKNIGKQLLRI